MNVSKDILRHLIVNYFHLTEIYQCQFVSKFVRSCISKESLYNIRCNKLCINMQLRQNKYIAKRRKEDIFYLADLKINSLNDGLNHIYLRKKIIEKYTKQEGDTRCGKCLWSDTPNKIKEHMKNCNARYFINCKECGCLNIAERKSPHSDEGCPLFKYYHCNECKFSAPIKFLRYHCRIMNHHIEIGNENKTGIDLM